MYSETIRVRLYPSEKAKLALLELFNKGQYYRAGCASIWTGLLDKYGTRYGSFKDVNQVDLHGRRYIVEMWDGKPSILLLDTLFETEQSLPAEHCYHRIGWRKNLKRRRYLRYKRGEITFEQIYKRRRIQ